MTGKIIIMLLEFLVPVDALDKTEKGVEVLSLGWSQHSIMNMDTQYILRYIYIF